MKNSHDNAIKMTYLKEKYKTLINNKKKERGKMELS